MQVSKNGQYKEKLKKTSTKHPRNIAFYYDSIKCLSFNLSLFQIIIIIITISSLRRESVWGSGDTAQLNLQVSASIKSAAGPIDDINHCESNRCDNDYYYGDNDGYYSNNDNDNDNDNSLTEATN
jgi:hypothetical protein